MATIVEVKYFNSFWMKKLEKTTSPVIPDTGTSQPAWPGLEWDPFG